MFIVEVKTGRKHEIFIAPLESRDFRKLTKKRYFFNWKEEKTQEIYKICKLDNLDIIGLVSFERIPLEWRIHIRLLSVSVENKGKEKQFEHIIGNLIAFVGRESMKDFGEMCCVSLIPKSRLAQHYMEKYGMVQTGMTLSVELPEIVNLLKSYGYEK